VIDLKWSRWDARRREEIKEGRAIQLATYSRLLDPGGGVPAGYFLIRQQRLLAEEGSPLALNAIRVARTLDDTWDAIEADWRSLSRIGRHGQGVARGIPGAEEHLPEGLSFESGSKACNYCDFSRLCRSAANGEAA